MNARRLTACWLLLAACGGGAPAADAPKPVSSGGASSGADPASGGPAWPVQIACGDFHTCALMSDKTVRCWGRNQGGELGDGTAADKSKPTAVLGVKGVEQLALGANFVCARMGDGSVLCWGTGRVLGDGKLRERLAPTVVPGISGVADIVAGGYVVCGRVAGGAAKCWGLDAPIDGPGAVSALSAASAHACARLPDDTARCWGEGAWSTTFSNPKLSGVRAISTGDSFACAVLADGTTHCWGRNDEGELGTAMDSDDHTKPVAALGSAAKVVALSSAESHSCALSSEGTVTCWGGNTEAELGRGTRTTSEKPGAIPALTGVKQVALGADHGCALAGKDVLCWGNNRNGQLGDGTTERRESPVHVVF